MYVFACACERARASTRVRACVCVCVDICICISGIFVFVCSFFGLCWNMSGFMYEFLCLGDNSLQAADGTGET